MIYINYKYNERDNLMVKTLGINISHNVSFAYFEDNILKEYYEEDRFNKIKHFVPYDPILNYPYEYQGLKKFKNITFDKIVFVSYDRGDILVEKAFIEPFLKQIKFKDLKFYFREHHIFHALSGFYFSNFDEALGLVCDGGGEMIVDKELKIDSVPKFQVMESIYYINKNEIKPLYKHHSCARHDHWNNFYKIPSETNFKRSGADIKISNKLCGGLKYLFYMDKAGFPQHAEGQLMGVAAYKNKKTDIDNNVIENACKAQEESLIERIELVKKAKTYGKYKNIVLSGGYHLNCANNFKLVKNFPELNFFVDPISHDGGTAVGAAYASSQYEENFVESR